MHMCDDTEELRIRKVSQAAERLYIGPTALMLSVLSSIIDYLENEAKPFIHSSAHCQPLRNSTRVYCCRWNVVVTCEI